MKKGKANTECAKVLLEKFDDLVEVIEVSRKCKALKEFKAAVKALSTPKDGMSVWKLFKCKSYIPGDAKPVPCTMAWVTGGLNGGGRQADYLRALVRLVEKTGVRIAEAHVDLLDDVFSVKVTLP